MTRRLLAVGVMACALAVAQQTPGMSAAPNTETKRALAPAEPEVRHVQSGSGVVEVDPKQPYRPMPANRAQTRETIFEFYLKALNPRQIKWGDEIDRRLAVLAEQSVGNPYFRLCALQVALILILLLTCWLWWDKMHQIKWVAAECLTDAINAKRIADHKALEAIGQYNRHIEMCNRVIENQESGIATGSGSEDLRRELRDAQTQLTSERAKVASLEAELKNRDGIQKNLESRLQQLEKLMAERQGGTNAELVARLQRAEAELSNRKTQRS
jgi:hypothetical protein